MTTTELELTATEERLANALFEAYKTKKPLKMDEWEDMVSDEE